MKGPYEEMEQRWAISSLRENERRLRREATIDYLKEVGEWGEVDQLRDLVRRLTDAYRNVWGSGNCNYDLLREALDVVKAMPPPPWE